MPSTSAQTAQQPKPAVVAKPSTQEDQAVKELRHKAELGDAEAQNNLGFRYYNGVGVPQDYGQAVAWFRRAAEQGDATAQFALGVMCEAGQGVPKNDAQAVAWYRKAAAQGDAGAQVSLGFL
ncbi:MAG: tetratricopeptide repeat protein, partial [Acidobacteria bacterium]|nr:tetratricopeptide repeat protein [Acidobacteriota bacterium]